MGLKAHRKSTQALWWVIGAVVAVMFAIPIGSWAAMHPLDVVFHSWSLANFFVGLLRRRMANKQRKLHLPAKVRLECPICWDIGLDPSSVVLLTPCGHVLCKPCAQDVKPQAKGAKCHACRQSIKHSHDLSGQ